MVLGQHFTCRQESLKLSLHVLSNKNPIFEGFIKGKFYSKAKSPAIMYPP